MNSVQAILFDLDGTLRIHLPSGGEVFTAYIRSLGLPISDEVELRAARWEHYYFANSPEIRADKKTFQADSRYFWINFSRRRLVALGFHPREAIELSETVSAHMAEAYKPRVHVPGELQGVLSTLKDAGYVLGVVSNRDEPYRNELKEMGLDAYFQFSLAAGEVSSFKPEPGIFLRALELAGSDAHETIYVGDNYFADALGAHHAGLLPVLYDPSRIFPNAEFPAIKSFDELPELINLAKV